jgi:hypothetical protein
MGREKRGGWVYIMADVYRGATIEDCICARKADQALAAGVEVRTDREGEPGVE